jgi:type I restriction enzyme S subunit
MVVNCDHNKEVSKDFLYYILRSQDLSTCITGTGQPQIIRGPLSNFELAVPCGVAEQKAIAEVLSDMDAEIAALEQRLAKTRALKQGMMQELLTGKTRLVGS